MNAEAPVKKVATQPVTKPEPLIECVNPANGALLGTVRAATPEQVNEQVARARVAQKRWAKSSFAQRRAVLKHIMNHVIAHADELCDEIVQDSGKTYENAMLGEILPICNKIKWTIGSPCFKEKLQMSYVIGPFALVPHICVLV